MVGARREDARGDAAVCYLGWSDSVEVRTMPVATPVAVVSGANRGIGREVARQLAEHNFTVVLGSRDPAKGRRAAQELDPSGTRILPHQLDITDPASIAALAEWIRQTLGRADVLINNAAILY